MSVGLCISSRVITGRCHVTQARAEIVVARYSPAVKDPCPTLGGLAGLNVSGGLDGQEASDQG